MALGLTLGVVLATSGNGTSSIKQSALGATATPTASASAAAAATSPAATATTAPLLAGSFANGRVANQQLGDVATVPVDGQGNALNLNQDAAMAAASGTCTLIVPPNALSAAGLATPWQLSDGCAMTNAAEQAFVEATILSPGGQVTVYNPLVITAGTTAAATPVAPTIAPGSQVVLDIGFNGTNLALTGSGARQARCVDALGQSLIGQVSACNAVNFYKLANALIANGTLVIPPAGTSLDGQQCLNTRNFGTVDQDQSDNVITAYLLTGNGTTAQNTAANAAALAGSMPIINGSDDKLLDAFLLAANGCTAFTAPDTTDPNGTAGSQALNELSARFNAPMAGLAVVPVNDPMTLVAAAFSVAKTNVYRSLVDQPLLMGNVNPTMVAADYCQNLVNVQPKRNQLDMTRELNFGTPVPAVGNNLATFLGNRLNMAFTNLNCQNFGLTNPATVTLDGNAVAIAVTYNLNNQTAVFTPAATTPHRFHRGGGNGKRNQTGKDGQNPAGA